MDRRANQLAEYVRDRLGDSLRAVGYHTIDDFAVVHLRDDLVDRYPPDRVNRFIRTSRHLHADLQYLDDEMGSPTASLHVLDEGLIVQFHYAGDDVVFLSMDKDVGRDFTRFIDDCLDRME